jgi:predicted XRE-type DNA-binding protein
VELQALVAAALGHYEQAAMLQRQILPSLQWLSPEIRQEAKAVLAAYERHEMPTMVWYRDNRLLQPPVTDVQMMFKEYPAAVPF